MTAKARSRKIDQMVRVKGHRKRLRQSVLGHICTNCGRTIEQGEFYTWGIGNLPVCRGCGPFELEEQTMQQQQSNDQDRAAREAEASYRRGYAYATQQTARLVLQLLERGHTPTEIRRLVAVYEDHMLATWRSGDLDTREAAPNFDVEPCLKILAGTTS